MNVRRKRSLVLSNKISKACMEKVSRTKYANQTEKTKIEMVKVYY